ncbi:type II toxin-antitoxin system PemK/MazF family toxin [Paenibacillus harenae]|uniref:type II toxin-antitoxin system PemK/MazF family toxin n=1 Tax=Paenibacillus harenae TaxID=306543 RepID=UPI00048C5C2E|nr:type II toxin-antitoxin system PemK/MazF family toxin [Paenibacillus harenae]
MLRGQVWIAELGESRGCEQAGARPVLIIQNDTGNKFSPTVIVAAITDAKKRYMPTHVNIGTHGRMMKPSVILLEQIRTIDKSKVDKYVCTLPDAVMKEVEKKLLISLGIEL